MLADMRTQEEEVHGALTLHRVLGSDRSALLATLSQLVGSPDIAKFPGSNPCSLERADFPKLARQPYFLTEKTNGVRFLLFCCRHEDHTVCALVDRAMAVFLLPLQKVPTVLFEGTVIDCELAFNRADRHWQLLMFDAYVVSGIPVMHKPFSARMAAVRRGMLAYEPAPGDAVVCCLKTFFPASAAFFDHFLLHQERVDRCYDVDGVILVPENSRAILGRHTELFKLKTKHTIDFLVGVDGFELGVFNPSSGAHVAIGRLRSAVAAGSIAECVQEAGGVWVLVCVRTDKTTANDMLTYEKTLLNAREAITLAEVRAYVERQGA